MRANLFKKTKYATTDITKYKNLKEIEQSKPNVPDGILIKCPLCGKSLYIKELIKNYRICDECGNYFKLPAYERIKMIVDEGEFEEFDKHISVNDPLNFQGYKEKIIKLQSSTGLTDGLITGKSKIMGICAMLGVMDSSFMMASMGTVIGEKLTRLFERATEQRLPVIIFTASGGARMQEGIFSLMQMAKVSAAVAKHSQAGLLYITVLTDPTTGGVTASFAMEGDIIIAEPNALIGFAGPRVIEQTIGQKLPQGFQKSEFLLEHGFIDMIVERNQMKKVLGNILKIHRI